MWLAKMPILNNDIPAHSPFNRMHSNTQSGLFGNEEQSVISIDMVVNFTMYLCK